MLRRLTQAISNFWRVYGGKLLFLLTLVWLILAILGLRHNNLVMGELRQAVFAADQTTNRQVVEAALQNLRQHVLDHMNTNLNNDQTNLASSQPTIQLPYLYYHDTMAVYEELITELGADHVAILNQARQICEAPEYRIEERLNCVATTTQARGDDTYPDLPTLAKDYYQFDFPSPRWSPDLAGWSIVFSGLCFLVLAGRVIWRVLQQVFS